MNVFSHAGAPALHVDDTGGSGPPVIFQHGLCGAAGQPAEVFPDETGFRRITLDMRGHGRSEAGDLSKLSIAVFADDIMAFIEQSGQGPVIIGGISMGAAIAMRIAVLRPDLVRGLILARPAWSLSAGPPNMLPNAEVGALLASLDRNEARSIFEKSETARRLAAEAPDNLASLMGFFEREPQHVTAALLQAISADGPGVTASQLRSIKVPTLVIGHGMDAVHPLALAEELAAVIPGARLATITPKAADRIKYMADFRAAMASFLKGHFNDRT
jgi:pimeloyl-ACP methyl ester carboxylesterase